MQDVPLTVRTLYERARWQFPDKQLVSRRAGGGRARTNYGEWAVRVERLAGGLAGLGVGRGDRVATLCFNHDRHLEVYFAAALMGASYHTVNIRLSSDQLAYVLKHARDRVLVVDAELADAAAAVLDELPALRHLVLIDAPARAVDAQLPVHDYETLLDTATPMTDWPRLDEQSTAGICYTSATTGNPKGVAYSHRALFVHSLAIGHTDTVALSEHDVALPIVPMFHVNAWGLPFAATWFGAAQVFGGPAPRPEDYLQLIREEGVTIAAGVPTVWLGVLAALDADGGDLGGLRRIVCGGSAAPVSLIRAYEQRYGVEFIHAYGMTEATPLTHVCRLTTAVEGLPEDARFAIKAKQGILVPSLQQRLVDEQGNDLPFDGKAMGELLLRGPWVADRYLDDPRTADSFVDGWYRTGDVATIDHLGYLQLVDRTKDLVKSGGEWISSVDLENALMGHPAVAEAAVIAVPDDKWGERPIAVVVRKPGVEVGEAELVASIAAQFPKWWLPDRVEFVAEIPKTATGKFSKRTLRAQFVGDLVAEDATADER